MKTHNDISDTDCSHDTYGTLAQLVAQPIVDRKVTGSSPVRPANTYQEAARAPVAA